MIAEDDVDQHDGGTADADVVEGASEVAHDATPGPLPCAKAKDCVGVDPERPYCSMWTKTCVQCIVDYHCGGGVCVDNVCTSPNVACVPGATSCAGGFRSVCRPDGVGFELQACPDDTPLCKWGSCRVCDPGHKGCLSTSELGHCNSDGSAWLTVQACTAPQRCLGYACKLCVPSEKSCAGSVAQQCDPDGDGWSPVVDCGAKGLTCLGGLCIDPCAFGLKTNTLGKLSPCDRVVVAPQGAVTALRLDAPSEGDVLLLPQSATSTAAPLAATKVGNGVTNLVAPTLPPGATSVAGLAILWLLTDVKAEVSSAISIGGATTAMTAFDGWHGPTGGGQIFRVAAWPQTSAAPVSIVVAGVDAQAAPTLTVTPTVDLTVHLPNAAPTLAKAGTATTIAGAQAVVLQTTAVGADATGSILASSSPVYVLVRGDAIHAPDSARCVGGVCAGQGSGCAVDTDCPPTCCADAFAFALRPAATGWVSKAYIARLLPRGEALDVLRIVADHDGTTVVLDPPIASVPTLAAGAHFDLPLSADVVLTASHGVGLLYVAVGSHAPGPGHPACVIAAGGGLCATDPAAGAQQPCATSLQCAPQLDPGDAEIGGPEIFVVPGAGTWSNRSSYATRPDAIVSAVTVVRAQPLPVTLDGAAIKAAAFQPIGGSAVSVARVVLTPGTHVVQAAPGSGGVQVVWHGWSHGRGHAVAAH